MGRPIHKKYFANRNYQLDGEGVGGESFNVVTVLTTGTLYSTTTNYTWTGSTPQIAGGEAASGTLSIGTDRRVSAFNVSNGGSGYTSTSSVTVTVSPATTGTTATYHVALTAAARENGLAMYAYLPASGAAGYLSGAGGSSRLLSDVIRQAGNNKYVVQNSQGVGVVRLVADGSAANAAGEADLTATDWNGSTYRVIKLHAKKARLKQVTSSTSFLIEDGAWAQWTITAATGTTVLLANA
jgi:hypothetical protein